MSDDLTRKQLKQIAMGEILPTLLNDLNDDPSWQNVQDLVELLLEIEEAAQWFVGDILVFMRHRIDFKEVARFEWGGRGRWPSGVKELLWERYGYRLREGERGHLACWRTLAFEQVLVLSRWGEIRVWETKGDFGDVAFLSYVKKIESRLLMGQVRSLRLYYQGALAFEPGRRPRGWMWNRVEEIIERETLTDFRLGRKPWIAREKGII